MQVIAVESLAAVRGGESAALASTTRVLKTMGADSQIGAALGGVVGTIGGAVVGAGGGLVGAGAGAWAGGRAGMVAGTIGGGAYGLVDGVGREAGWWR